MATPTKRRVLGPIDVNIQMSPRSSKVSGSPLKKATSREGTATVSRHASPSPRKPSSKQATPKKRPLEGGRGGVQPASKKLCSDFTAATTTEVSAPANVEPVQKHAAVQDVDEDEPSASQPTAGRRSISPDTSSVFDTSGMNTSQDTTITEPDTDAPITITATATAPASTPSSVIETPSSLSPPPPPPRRVPTREEFRQKAEILRLRLSLATYKVKTGQTDVPLDKLQVRPVPGMARHRTPLPSMSAHTIQRSTPAQQWYRSLTPPGSRDVVVAVAAAAEEEGTSHDKAAGKPSPPEKSVLPLPSVLSTPRKRSNDDEEEEARLTSSALRGGAAKGLLSLSQGSPL